VEKQGHAFYARREVLFTLCLGIGLAPVPLPAKASSSRRTPRHASSMQKGLKLVPFRPAALAALLMSVAECSSPVFLPSQVVRKSTVRAHDRRETTCQQLKKGIGSLHFAVGRDQQGEWIQAGMRNEREGPIFAARQQEGRNHARMRGHRRGTGDVTAVCNRQDVLKSGWWTKTTGDLEMSPCNLPGAEFRLDFRLVEVGEVVTFTLRGATPDDRLEIFPRYLECCDAERARQSPLALQWLDGLEREMLPTEDTVAYTPRVAGNYIARWPSQRHGVEYRYFAAIDQSYVIYRPAVWSWPTPFPATGGPEIHNGGLPLDWCVSSDKTDEPYVPRLLEEQQRYGGGIVYGIKSSCDDRPAPEVIAALQNTIADFRQHGFDRPCGTRIMCTSAIADTIQ